MSRIGNSTGNRVFAALLLSALAAAVLATTADRDQAMRCVTIEDVERSHAMSRNGISPSCSEAVIARRLRAD